MTFELDGETPAKKNSRIFLKNGRNIPSKRYSEWHMVSGAAIQSQRYMQHILKPLEGPVKISVVFTHGDKRRRDSDNGLSSVLDLLVDTGVLKDDNWTVVPELEVTNKYEQGAAKCLIEIKQL